MRWSCRGCEGWIHRVVDVIAGRIYSKCSRCGLIYLVTESSRHTYEADYFEDEYRRVYGRTYLEDFTSIQAAARPRLDIIEVVGGKLRGRLLLDVGCAYGPFLLAARQRGAAATGVEVSHVAAQHVKLLRFPVYVGRFEDYPLETVDVLTMWYTVEHFPNLREVLEKVAAMVRPGGVFAFSTPTYRGISGRRDLGSFLQAGAPDHYTVWCPEAARRLLNDVGFDIKRVRVTGHHGDRWPIPVPNWISKVTGLGDTFEVYGIKQRGNE